MTGVDDALRGGFANVELVSGGSVTAVEVSSSLILNGTGNLVTYKDAEEKIQLGGADVAATGKLITTGENATIGKITVTGAGNVNVKGGLTVQHGAADVVAVSADAGIVDVDGNLTVNGDATIGTLNVAGVVTMGTVKTPAGVEDDADLTIKTKLEVAEGGELVANGKVKLNTDDNYVNGVAKIGELDATGKKIFVGDATHAGTIVIGKLTGGTVFGDPNFATGETTMDIAAGSKIAAGTSAADATVIAGRATLAALGVDTKEGLNAAVDLIKANGFTEYVKNEATSLVYVDGTNGAYAGKVIADNIDPTDSLTGYTVPVAVTDKALVFVDQATVEDGAALFVKDAKIDGELYVANANATKTFKITEGDLSGDFDEDDIMVSADRILGAELDDGEVSVYVKEGDELGQLANAVTIDTISDYYAQGLNNGSAWFEGMMTRVEGGPSDKDVVTALNDVAAVGATAGMAAVTMDALSAFNDTVAARTSILAPNAEGTTVWADVNGGKYEAKKLMNGAGYSSDIYAGVLGVDTTVACGAKIGAAITVGTGDTDSKNTSAVTSMDSDFFGVSIYTAKAFGNANVAVDFGYMQGSNDVTVKAYGLDKFSADSDAFTIGVRGEYLLKAGDFNVVPHAGLRWTRLTVDDFVAGYTADLDSMNVFQLPIGVTVTGEFEAAGWTLAPAFDLTVVPAFGDKDQDIKLGLAGANVQTTNLGVQVIDSNPVQATLGLEAVNGAWAFGLNYKLGVGTDSRMNNSFNANVRYTF